MNILHISYQWPNIMYSNSGIFVKNTLEKLILKTPHRYSLLIANKLINKEYIKEKKFTLKNYIGFLGNANYYSSIPDLKMLQKLYPPLLGIKSAAGYNAVICWLFNRKSILRFVRENNINLIHAHFSNPDGYIANEIKKETGIPYVMHLHGRDVQEYNLLTEKEKKIIQKVYKEADHVVCNSNKTKNLLEKIISNSLHTSIITFGVDAKIEEHKKEALNDPVQILSVGNLVKIKGIDLVLDALHTLKDKINYSYSIIGDGPVMNSLKEKTTALGLQHSVRFLGRQNHDIVTEYMKNSDIFVLPSYNEAFGIVYLEALACGCATIGVKTQGCEDINTSGECIYLTEPKNVDSIVNAFNDIINNPDKRLAFRSTGFRVINEIYSWDNITRQLDNVYCDIVKI